MFVYVSHTESAHNVRTSKTKSNFPQVSPGEINLLRIFPTFLSLFSTHLEPNIPPLAHQNKFFTQFPQWRSTFQNSHRCSSLVLTLFSLWDLTIPPKTKKLPIYPSSPSQSHRNHLRSLSSLRDTGLWSSLLPPTSVSRAMEHSNLSESLSCWKFISGSSLQDQIQGPDPLSSLTPHLDSTKPLSVS